MENNNEYFITFFVATNANDANDKGNLRNIYIQRMSFKHRKSLHYNENKTITAETLSDSVISFAA